LNADLVIVGSGLFGLTIAERCANDLGLKVLVLERRHHIGGNAYSEPDPDTGIEVHVYGAHLFHTSNKRVWDYVNRFTSFTGYQHRVFTQYQGRVYPMPVNLATICEYFGRAMSPAEARALVAEQAGEIDSAKAANLEEKGVSLVGRPLYEAFFRGYTLKQWQLDPSQLHASVASRIPTRTNTDDRYFTDTFQKMPAEGYTAMFARMLDHPRIELALGVDYFDLRERLRCGHVVFTGPIDLYFGRCYGELPYRSLEFELRNVATPDGGLVQETGTQNEPSADVPYTRTTEFRHLTGQRRRSSTLCIEYPRATGDPYYPIPSEETKALYKRYEALARREDGVTFVGRLARYQYLNMDQVTAQALGAYAKLAERLDVPVAA